MNETKESRDLNIQERGTDYFFWAWLLFLAIYLIFFNITFVSGTSMDPTLKDKDILIMEKASVFLDNLNRGDIVSFKHQVGNDDVFFIKRIIGIPGDTIEIKGGQVYVNNDKIDESYLPKNTQTFLESSDTLKTTLKENEYFVLGDNRDNSLDSRFKEVGAVQKEDIFSKKLVKILNIS